MMPADFFPVTLAGIARILRLWGLQEELEMYNGLTYVLYVFVQYLVRCDPDTTMWAF